MHKILSLSLLILISACSTQGDFGRKDVSPFKENIITPLGNWAATARKEPVAHYYPLTDHEQHLRNMGYPLLQPMMPDHPIGQVKDFIQDKRFISRDKLPKNTESYGNLLRKVKVNSHEGYYNVLERDIQRDFYHFNRFCEAIPAVLHYDQSRMRAFNEIFIPKSKDEKKLLNRIKENIQEIKHVEQQLKFRKYSYQKALEALIFQAPSERTIAIGAIINEYPLNCDITSEGYLKALRSIQNSPNGDYYNSQNNTNRKKIFKGAHPQGNPTINNSQNEQEMLTSNENEVDPNLPPK